MEILYLTKILIKYFFMSELGATIELELTEEQVAAKNAVLAKLERIQEQLAETNKIVNGGKERTLEEIRDETQLANTFEPTPEWPDKK